MTLPEVPFLSWLYTPGDRSRLVISALSSDADVVVIDLEDAVSVENKARARDATVEVLADAHDKPVLVRINHPSTPWGADDLAALAGLPGLDGFRVPKVETTDDIEAVADVVSGDLPPLFCLVESALGVENAFVVASHPAVSGLALGEADLRAELGVTTDDGLAWPRSRIVVAAAAAGLAPPPQTVYPQLNDPEGLAESCRVGRRLGFLGRSAIHPEQLDVIVEAYRPDPGDVERARAIVAAADAAPEAGALTLDDGTFIDRPILDTARRCLALADRYERL